MSQVRSNVLQKELFTHALIYYFYGSSRGKLNLSKLKKIMNRLWSSTGHLGQHLLAAAAADLSSLARPAVKLISPLTRNRLKAALEAQEVHTYRKNLFQTPALMPKVRALIHLIAWDCIHHLVRRGHLLVTSWWNVIIWILREVYRHVVYHSFTEIFKIGKIL